MPGGQLDVTRRFPADLPPTADHDVFSAVARFRDSMGVHWLIRPGGQLTEEVEQR
jgi:hypothetical protein